MAGNGTRQLRQRHLGELLRQLSEEARHLMRDEVELAKAEMSEKGERAGVGAGMIGVAVLSGVVAFACLVVAAIAALALAVPLWSAALIVAGILAVIGAMLAAVGGTTARSAGPPLPEETVESVKENVEWAKRLMK